MIQNEGLGIRKFAKAGCQKLILVIYALGPNLGSEPGVGWSYLQAAKRISESENRELHLITSEWSYQLCKKDLNALKATKGNFAMDIISFSPKWGYISRRLAYVVFWFKARHALRLHLSNFKTSQTLIHHVNLSSELFPPVFWKLERNSINEVRVWGPVGAQGNVEIAKFGIDRKDSFLQSALQLVRDSVSRLVFPVYANKTNLVLSNNQLLQNIGRKSDSRVVWYPNFVCQKDIVSQLNYRPSAELCIATVGVLEKRKMVHLAISMLQDPRLSEYRLRIFGDGPQRERLQRLAVDQHVDSRIVWEGHLPQKLLFEELQTCSVIVQTSYREGAPWSVGEAIALEIPVVCFDNTGSSQLKQYYGIETGIVRDYSDKSSAVKNLCSAVLSLSNGRSIPQREVINEASLSNDLAAFYGKC